MDGEKIKPIGSAIAGGVALVIVQILKVLYYLIMVSGSQFGSMGGLKYLTSGSFIQSVIFSFITGIIGGGLYALVYNWTDK